MRQGTAYFSQYRNDKAFRTAKDALADELRYLLTDFATALKCTVPAAFTDERMESFRVRLREIESKRQEYKKATLEEFSVLSDIPTLA